MNSIETKLFHSVSFVAIVMATACPAIAQDTTAEPSMQQESAAATPSDVATEAAAQTESDEMVLDEIIVTAQKRNESVNKVGMSISALSGAQLQTAGVVDVAGLTKVVPGFTFAQSPKGAPIYTLRGVGYYDETLAATPAVSIYLDQVGFSYPIESKAATLDIERVEVLKGPQGTLYGQSSTGGAINYIAVKPTSQLEAGLNLGYGRFDAFTAEGFVSGPITSTIRARIALATDQGGDWQRSYSRDDRTGGKDIWKGRILVDAQPTDRLTFNLMVGGWSDRSEPLDAALLAVTPQTPARATPTLLAQQPAPERPGVADWNAGLRQYIDEDFYQAALRTDYELSDATTITSITSYQDFRQDDLRDTDGSALTVFSVNQRGKIRSFAQELRAAGRLVDDRLHWLVGAVYNDDRVRETGRIDWSASTNATTFAGLQIPFVLGFGNRNRQDIVTKAAFGNVDFDVLPSITLHAGMRYTSSRNDFVGCTHDLDGNLAAGINRLVLRRNPAAPPVVPGGCITVRSGFTSGEVTDKLYENNISWRVGLDWKALDHTLLFVTVSKGYKPGSFPVIGATGSISLRPVTQESVLAYETGIKTDLLDRRVHLDASVFYYDYTNKQFRGRIIDPLGVFGAVEALVNVPKSRLFGAEANLTVRPTAGLTFNVAATYLDSKVTTNFQNFDPFGASANFKGEAFPFTPKWSMQAGGNYKVPVNASMQGFVGIHARYQSASLSAFGLSPTTPRFPAGLFNIKSYTLVDADAGIEAEDGKWRLSLYGKNIFNKYYWSDVFRQIDNTSRHVGEPATYGVRASYRY